MQTESCLYLFHYKPYLEKKTNFLFFCKWTSDNHFEEIITVAVGLVSVSSEHRFL